MSDVTLIVVPSRAVARQLELRLERNHLSSGEEVWITPAVITLETWLKRLWTDWGKRNVVVFSSYEEKLLWRQILAGTLFEQRWLEVREFYIWLNEYQATGLSFEPWDEELILLFRLIEHFQEKLCQFGATTVSDLPRRLLEVAPVIKPTVVTLVGFDVSVPPALGKLLAALRSGGTEFKTGSVSRGLATPQKFVADDEVQEWQEALLWLKRRYLESPGARYLGLVVPYLTDAERLVLKSLATHILDHDNIPWRDTTDEKAVISLPLMQQVIDFLDCSNNNLTTKKIARLLLSPYSNYAQIRPDYMRQQLAEKWLIAADCDEQLALPTEFHEKLIAAQRCLPEGLIATPTDWTRCFTAILNVWGWPNLTLKFTTQETAALALWPEFLLKFSAASSSFNRLTLKEALWLLEAILESSYLPNSEQSDAAITFLTPGAALALPFAGLWWSGSLFGKSLFPLKSPPWLVKSAIERYQSEPDDQMVVNAVLGNVREEAIFSSSRYDLHGEEQEMNETVVSFPPLKSIVAPSSSDQGNCVVVSESDSLPVWQELTAFNSRTCSLIARCPVRAFLELRFKTTCAEELTKWGIGRVERGIVVHQMLEQFWREVRSQKNLLTLRTDEIVRELKRLFRNLIDQYNYSSTIKELEEAYLLPLLANWLNFEKKRPAFTVLALEQKYRLKLGDLTLNLRIDRIDELASGDLLLIDYKTGLQHFSLAKWLREPLLEPQLMLYHLAEPRLSGLAIAELNQEEMLLHNFGLAELNSTWERLNGVMEKSWSWSDWDRHWQQQIFDLLQNFRVGLTPLQPADVDSCKNCYLKPFCRHIISI